MNSMILDDMYPGNSILYHMDPRAKLLGLFLLIIILFGLIMWQTILLFLLAFMLILSATFFRFFITSLKSGCFHYTLQLFATTGGKALSILFLTF